MAVWRPCLECFPVPVLDRQGNQAVRHGRCKTTGIPLKSGDFVETKEFLLICR